MLTPHQLSWALRRANVEAVSALAGVSTKTVYRIRKDAGALRAKTLVDLSAALEQTAPALFLMAQREPRAIGAEAVPAEAA